MHISQDDLQLMDRIRRLNIINSITGIKPGNLVGTMSATRQPNLAIMSSTVHLGSDPALIGLVFRPQDQSPRDTYLNIKETLYYTINHIPPHLTDRAHYTSAKFPNHISEFDRCGIKQEELHGFHAPFVQDSPIKFGLKFVQEIPIELNKTILVIGQVVDIHIKSGTMNDQGQIDLAKADSVGISGLDHYYRLEKIAQYPYTHVEDVPHFEL